MAKKTVPDKIPEKLVDGNLNVDITNDGVKLALCPIPGEGRGIAKDYDLAEQPIKDIEAECFPLLSTAGKTTNVKFVLCQTCLQGYVDDTECRYCLSFTPKCPKCGQIMEQFKSEAAMKEKIEAIRDYRSKGI